MEVGRLHEGRQMLMFKLHSQSLHYSWIGNSYTVSCPLTPPRENMPCSLAPPSMSTLQTNASWRRKRELRACLRYLSGVGEAFFFGDRQFKLTLDRSEKFQISKVFQWSCMRVEEECPGTSRNECGRARNYSEQLLHVVRVLFWNVNRTEFAQERMYNQWRTPIIIG